MPGRAGPQQASEIGSWKERQKGEKGRERRKKGKMQVREEEFSQAANKADFKRIPQNFKDVLSNDNISGINI